MNIAIQQYIQNNGECSSTGGGGHCPLDCSTIAGSPVCDSSLQEYSNSCEMVKQMCGDGIISFDDSADFDTMSDDEFYSHVQTWVQWIGPCNGVLTNCHFLVIVI